MIEKKDLDDRENGRQNQGEPELRKLVSLLRLEVYQGVDNELHHEGANSTQKSGHEAETEL